MKKYMITRRGDSWQLALYNIDSRGIMHKAGTLCIGKRKVCIAYAENNGLQYIVDNTRGGGCKW